eukprot:gene7060-7274_t
MVKRNEEESIYAWSRHAPAAAPTVKTYNVPAPPTAPKPKMHVDSSQVESILNPVRGIRDAQARAGITPTNHSRHNILAVKEQSRINALQKQQQAETVAAQQPFTPQLHRSASSSSGAAAAAAPRAQAFGRSSSAGSSSGRVASSSGALRSISGDDADTAAPSRNFVQENKAAAAATSRPVKAESRFDEGTAYLQKNEYGQVPAYLLERKLQLAQEQDALMAAKQAAQIPAGLRQLPEEERLHTLEVLRVNRAEVEARLASLPIIIETPSQVRRKDELERRLQEIESAQKIFSRRNVLVHATAQQQQ